MISPLPAALKFNLHNHHRHHSVGAEVYAVAVDKGKKASLTRDVRRWSNRPNRLDVQGIDTPGLSKHTRARIDILAKLNTWSSTKKGCGDPTKRLELLKSTGRYDKKDLDAAFDVAKEAVYFD